MKNCFAKFLLVTGHWILVAGAVHAAGTYYTGGYQSPQTRYATQSYAQRQAAARPTSVYTNPGNYSRYQPVAQQKSPVPSPQSPDKGFWLDAGISYAVAQWQFDMEKAGSILHFDNIAWNILDVNAGYKFGNTTPMEISGGVQFGFQGADSKMIDDDITNGGIFVTDWYQAGSQDFIGSEFAYALSSGTTSDGDLFGYNLQFGFTDFFKLGRTKITPSVGWRSFTYKLQTSQNYGLMVDTTACFALESGEIQCDPALIVNYGDNDSRIIWRDDINSPYPIGGGATSVNPGDTYYFQLPGVSHSYEVAWDGPYIALGIDYEINQYNAVGARAEVGFPGYTATGDQPYRPNWAHPKSVEDKAGIGSALHFALSGDWKTAITDRIMLTFGITYDYYNVSGADAKTFLNEGFYTDLYEQAQDIIDNYPGTPDAQNAANIQAGIEQTLADCPGWVCTDDSEVAAFYKSLGVRVGLNAKF